MEISEIDVNGVNTQDVMHDLIFFAKEFYDVIGFRGEKIDELVKKVRVLDGVEADKLADAVMDVRGALGSSYNAAKDFHQRKREN